jgi:nucleoside-diphosphate-sugar epimerase
MRIFVTGATGFIGSAVVRELIKAGHQVLGLARSDAAAKSLSASGAQVHKGDVEDLESLRSGAASSDAVIHTAFIHDFSKYEANCEIDKRAIEALGSTLVGSDRPLIVTSGTALVSPGHLAKENMGASGTFPRVASEEAALSIASRGVRASVIRLPPSVHGVGDHGFVPLLIALAREKGASAYVGNGLNRWPAAHQLDVAHLYSLVLEKGSPGTRYHGVAEEGVLLRDIAGVIGRRLNLPILSKSPEEAIGHFGWFADFVAIDAPASSEQTRQLLGWQPKQPGLIADVDRPNYFQE